MKQRKSKIKCVNTGSPPCQKCEKVGNTACELTRPHAKTPKRASRRAPRLTPLPSSTLNSPSVVTAAPQTPLPNSPPVLQSTLTTAVPAPSSPDEGCVNAHLASLPLHIILKALNIFTAKFPELRILQPSAFLREYQGDRSLESRILLATVLAITRKQSSLCSDTWLDSLQSSSAYASYAWRALSDVILQPPNIQVIQGLLILTLYEWGVRDFHKAWMHCGESRKCPFFLKCS